VFVMSRGFFKKYCIDLQVTSGAVKRIADEAVKSRRIGARALKEVYGRIIKPLEYDPYGHEAVKKIGDGYQLILDEDIVRQALRPLYESVI